MKRGTRGGTGGTRIPFAMSVLAGCMCNLVSRPHINQVHEATAVCHSRSCSCGCLVEMCS